MIHVVLNPAPTSTERLTWICVMHFQPCSSQSPNWIPLGAFCNHIDSGMVLFLGKSQIKTV